MDVCAVRSMFSITQMVSRSPWAVTKTVPGVSVGSPAGYVGSHPGAQLRSPSGVKKPMASAAGIGSSKLPAALRRMVMFLPWGRGALVGRCRRECGYQQR